MIGEGKANSRLHGGAVYDEQRGWIPCVRDNRRVILMERSCYGGWKTCDMHSYWYFRQKAIEAGKALAWWYCQQ